MAQRSLSPQCPLMAEPAVISPSQPHMVCGGTHAHREEPSTGGITRRFWTGRTGTLFNQHGDAERALLCIFIGSPCVIANQAEPQRIQNPKEQHRKHRTGVAGYRDHPARRATKTIMPKL